MVHMDALASLLTLSDAYGRALNIAEGTVSERVLKGGNRLRDLRAGSTDIGVRRLHTAIQWFSDHWPAGLDWPKGVDRPSPKIASAEATP